MTMYPRAWPPVNMLAAIPEGAPLSDTVTEREPGTVVCADRRGIEVACGEGKTLRITELQPAGKKRMSAASWLLGHPIRVG